MDLATVRRRLADHWGGAVPIGELYVAHHERAVFQTVTPTGTRVVVKASAEPARLAAEAVAIQAASAAGIPTPEVVEQLPGLLVLSWLEGQPLLTTSPDHHWAAVGRALRRLHDHAAPDGVPGFAGSADWWGWFHSWLPGAPHRTRRLFPPPVADRLCRILEAGVPAEHAPATRLLHGDAATIHWRIRRDGTAAALDFGDACAGDPVWDLVVLTHWDQARLPRVLDGYRAGRALRARVARLFPPYRVSRHLYAVEWLCSHGYDPTPTLRELTRLATS